MKTKIALFTASLILPISAAPGWMAGVNTPKTGALRPIEPCHLSYEIAWNGKIKAGTFDVIFGKKDPRYPKYTTAQGYGGSVGWARGLYPFSFNYLGILNPRTLRPVAFSGTETEGNEVDYYQTRFSRTGATGVKTTKTKAGKTVKTRKANFAYPQPLGLFSGLLQIRSLDLKKGDKITMPFFPISKPYLAKVTVLGRENFQGRPAIKLDIGLQKIGPDMKLQHYKKLKTATVWLSDDTWRVPLQIRAKVFVGDVRVTIRKHERLK